METIPAKRSLSEDWTVVLLGGAIILLSLAGLRSPAPDLNWSSFPELAAVLGNPENLARLGSMFLITFFAGLAGVLLMRRPLLHFVYMFPVVFLLSVLALILAANSQVQYLNLEAVIFSLTIGLIVGNFFRLPAWFRAALSTEMFVKTGLVLLGTAVIFGDVLKAGSYGLIQALAVVLAVWYFAYWICKRLGIDRELTMMIPSAVAICGVSAAIATAGAIRGDTRKLSYVISLVLITAIPMMIGMPYLARWMGLSEAVTGAWLGGTIDTTGAVVAAGTLVGEEALKISTIVKFSQNVLLGLAAFAISAYWTISGAKGEAVEKPGLKVIWDRFPKFVLGFLGASLLFSFAISPEVVAATKSGLKNIQTLWFVLAFTSIGLETNFRELLGVDNRRPMYAFLIAQGFNILVTLVIAWFLFGYLQH